MATIPNIDSNTSNMVESILDIIEGVNRTLMQSFNKLDVFSIAIPDSLKESYGEGNQLANIALSLADKGEYLQSGLKSIEALQKMNDALFLVDSLLPYNSTLTEEEAEKVISLKDAIVQTNEYIARLEKIQSNIYQKGYDSNELRKTIEAAKVHLEDASANLDILDIEITEQELLLAKSLLSESSLNNLTMTVKVQKTRVFIANTEKRLTSLRENITAISLNVSTSIRNASLYAISNAEVNLENAKHLIEINKVDDSTNELVKSVANIKVAIRTLESVGVKIEDAEEKPIQNIP